MTLGCIAMTVAGAGAAEEDGLETAVGAGLALADGNSESFLVNGSIVSEGEKEDLGTVRLGIEGNYGESTVEDAPTINVDNGRAFANVKKTLSEMTFAYLDGSALYDRLAQIDYRATVGPGAGTYVLNTEATRLSIEAGVAYIWESVAAEVDDYAALRVAERLEKQLGENARIWQAVEYLPRLDDFNSFLLNAELGVEAALNSRLNLRILVQDKYDSDPAPDLQENDLLLVAGLGARL